MTFEAEFTAHAPFLRALARRLATDEHTADDLVQETCVAALTGAPRPHGLVPWLAAVLRKRAARHMRTGTRRRARERTAARAPISADTADVAVKLDVARRLLQHVEALDAPGRDAIFLRYYENLKPQQIAARLDVPLGTVKTRLARALARLRERLDADHPAGRQNWLPALCAIGGLDPGTLGMPPGAGAVTTRAPVLRLLRNAAGLVLITTVAVTSLSWHANDPAPAQSTTASRGTALSRTTVDPRVQRDPLATASPATLVHGLVEDAAIGAAPGHGQPAANVTVRCRLRQPGGSASSHGAARAADAKTPEVLTVPTASTVEVEVTTDAQGHFQIELPDDAVLVAAKADGTEVLRAARWSAAKGVDRPPEQLVLTRYPQGRLEGIVTEPSGTAVAGARVTLTHRQDGERVAIETSADQDGHFVFATADAGSWLAAEREGFIQVGTSELRALPRGGWQPARILLAPAGTLTVEIVDASGRPALHVDGVGVAVGSTETGLFAATDCRPRTPLLARAPTAQGAATLCVPAGLDLVLLAGESMFVHEQDGQGVAPGSPTGRPISVGAGERRRLRLVLGTDLSVHVTVVDPDGQSASGADLWFEMVHGGYLESIRMATTDASGRFELPLSGAWRDQLLLITARKSGDSEGPRAVRRLQIDGAEPMFVELRLAPAQSLVGRVHDASGRAVAAQVRRLLRFPGEGDWIEHSGAWRTDEHGAFRVPSIAGAVQRLEVAGDGFTTAVRDDVRPGEPIEVVLEPAKRTRLRLLASASATAIGEVEVRVGHLEADDGVDPAWPALGPTTAWSHAALHALCTLPVPQRIRRPEGIWRLEVHRRSPRTDADARGVVELLLDRGPAWISVSARGPDGEPLSRVTTGPVTVAGDEVELPLTLSNTATCRGRIRFGEHSEHFAACVALADDGGRLLMISAPDHDDVWETVLAASSPGYFALSNVPIGTWELRVGTREELERGEARRRRRVVFAGELAEPIVVEL
ncbi:MAG TPA: sigma-70 family RNA polymerase sigma factor [Planctomycetota bacterium]|nr:sigma-70 family RNA polymerase sigma factor [Planctomycetota bacterium]